MHGGEDCWVTEGCGCWYRCTEWTSQNRQYTFIQTLVCLSILMSHFYQQRAADSLVVSQQTLQWDLALCQLKYICSLYCENHKDWQVLASFTCFTPVLLHTLRGCYFCQNASIQSIKQWFCWNNWDKNDCLKSYIYMIWPKVCGPTCPANSTTSVGFQTCASFNMTMLCLRCVGERNWTA